MFLFQRHNGYYYVVYADQNGKQKRISTKTKLKREAMLFFSDVRDEIKMRKQSKIIPTTFEQIKFTVLKHSELYHTEKTTKVYKTTFKFLIEHFNKTPLHEISKIDLQSYLDKRISDSSIFAARKDLICIKAIMKRALDEKYISSNPCVGIKMIKVPQKQPLYFSQKDFESLLGAVDDLNFKDLIIIAVYTGLRQMELLTLTWDQVDFNNKLINLNNRQHITKSKRVRTIPMNEKVYNVLQNKYEHRKSESVFEYDGRDISSKISQKFKKYIRKAILNEKLNFHSLRHTFASWLVQKDVSIYLISKLLGHSNIQTTEIYAHLKNDNLLSCINKL